MNSNFNSHQNSGQLSSENAQTSREMDILQRDRFELLSAYIDGEVTASERKQVQEWLTTDPEVQHLYNRLVKLRFSVQNLPIPTSEQSAEQTVKQVFRRINHRRSQRFFAWSGAAAAAVFIGTLSSVLSGGQSPMPQLAQSINPKPAVEPVMVALNKPVVEIPKAAVAAPEKSVKTSVFPSSQPE